MQDSFRAVRLRLCERRPVAVAIPARDERNHIESCLEALDSQVGATADHVVVLANNCTDGTASVARGVRLRPPTRLHVLEHVFRPAQASAGHARRLAMRAAAALVDPQGVILTTDADGRVDPDWLAANIAAIDAGADAVAGWVELFPTDWSRIPAALHEDDARECAYDTLCDEIHARLDPDPADPLPRHTQHAGASLAVTSAAYAACGGLPRVSSGEDRALISALRRIDARIRHAPGVHVTVSGRLEGRAAGGMADTIRRRLSRQDAFLDDRLEPAADCARRARARADVRRAFLDPTYDRRALAKRLGIEPSRFARLLDADHFGQAWQSVEDAAPALRRVAVPVADVLPQTEAARSILAALREPLSYGPVAPIAAAAT